MLSYEYVAGIIDGEGSVVMHPNSQGGFTGLLSVGNTSKILVDALLESCGGHIYTPKKYPTNFKPEGGKQIYHWQLHGQKALPLLRAITPHLLIKIEQAELLMEFLTEHCPGVHRQRSKEDNWGQRTVISVARCFEIANAVHELNVGPLVR